MSNSKQTFDTAMLEFQKLAVKAIRDGEGQHFKNKYSTLEEVIAAARQANQFGLYFMQPLDMIVVADQPVQVVSTIITHAPTGESRKSVCPIRLGENEKNNPQKMGSAITYAKRYSLQAAFGLPSEDDDGHEASKPANKPATVVKPDYDDEIPSF